ncbi:hypothetical protein C8J56DRAFT_1021981 [Mycena floridula]|nr:hypothetical protein C8J56DRAFT_1021981 [Mycena floridula]
MSRSPQIYYVLDNTYTGFSYTGGGQWSVFPSLYFQGGSITWPAFDVFGPNNTAPTAGTASLQLPFQGTSVALYGITTVQGIGIQNSQSFQVTMDGATPYTANTGDSPPHYIQWFQSRLVDQGDHVLQLDNINGTGVDYAVVTPGQDTPLDGQTLMVDDSYTNINYVNHWETQFAKKIIGAGSLYSGSSFQNTTHETDIVGAYMNFSWTGAELAVYGVYDWTLLGSYDLTVTVDNQQPFTVTFDSSTTNTLNVPNQPNVKLFTSGDLDPGDHTVVANLSRCVNQTLIIDYVQYTPGFSTLATMPILVDGHRSSPSVVGSTAAGKPTGLADSGSTSSKKVSTGAIVGGVVGGLVALVILGLLFFLWRRRQRRPESLDRVYPMQQSYAVDPFVAPSNSSQFTPLRRAPEDFSRPSTAPTFSSGPPSSIASFSATGSVMSPTVTTASRPEIRQRLMELQRLIEETENEGSVDDMRRQIEALREQNERLATMAHPPAYNDTDSSDANSSRLIETGPPRRVRKS